MVQLSILLLLVLAVAVGVGAFGELWQVRFRRAMLPAFVVGGIGFAAGFFGPIIFAPEANQGPLLGIFITGPIGFMLGLAWGIFRSVTQRD
jgi:hypothetical protein